ncbi:MAG TPA: 4-hydroxythreonine-4-phosphate dehydrogenase PdxA [Burkholderiales bacterium]|nr:4-hydroxythreonine-4-phosphate dehydrogenase PdxA [Burkholderiales bacterium]
MSLPRIAISIGDPAGIGPEIALKAALSEDVRKLCVPVLVGDRGALELHAAACGLTPEIIAVMPEQVREMTLPAGAVALIARAQLRPGELQLGEFSAVHGRAILDSATVAINAALAGQVDAVVAAPQTEKSVQMAGVHFDGYPTFVASVVGVPRDNAMLMLCFDDKRIVHVTLHTSVRKAIEQITIARVEAVIHAAAVALKRLGVAAPRIAVSGLNPHASEDGLFGDEEAEIISPAIARARAAGINVEGPYGADTFLAKAGFDAHVVMLHDQGHVAAKALAPNRAAGMTIGTPVLFSSVAHGSALDIAGQNKARPDAVIEAVKRLARVGSLAH